MTAAIDDSPQSCLLYVTDRTIGKRFLVDTGSDISIYSASNIKGQRQPASYQLYVTNGTIIPTYGIQPELGLRRAFPWRFVIAQITQLIIEADFLAYYNLLLNMKRSRLIDNKTGLEVRGTVSTSAIVSVKTMITYTKFYNILAEYPRLMRITGQHRMTKHETIHYIQTTPVSPEACRPRRLPLDRLKAAKAKFEIMLQESII